MAANVAGEQNNYPEFCQNFVRLDGQLEEVKRQFRLLFRDHPERLPALFYHLQQAIERKFVSRPSYPLTMDNGVSTDELVRLLKIQRWHCDFDLTSENFPAEPEKGLVKLDIRLVAFNLEFWHDGDVLAALAHLGLRVLTVRELLMLPLRYPEIGFAPNPIEILAGVGSSQERGVAYLFRSVHSNGPDSLSVVLRCGAKGTVASFRDYATFAAVPVNK